MLHSYLCVLFCFWHTICEERVDILTGRKKGSNWRDTGDTRKGSRKEDKGQQSKWHIWMRTLWAHYPEQQVTQNSSSKKGMKWSIMKPSSKNWLLRLAVVTTPRIPVLRWLRLEDWTFEAILDYKWNPASKQMNETVLQNTFLPGASFTLSTDTYHPAVDKNTQVESTPAAYHKSNLSTPAIQQQSVHFIECLKSI